MKNSTAAVHAGENPRENGSAVFPIYQSATFECHDAVVVGLGYGHTRYTRCHNNPSQEALARKIAAIEGGEAALVTSSGMSGISTTLLTFLKAGDHLLIQGCLYGATYTFVNEMLPGLGVEVTVVNVNDPQSWVAATKPNTKVFYVEAISNPLCGVPNLQAVVDYCRQRKILTLIDNTFASPANFKPLLFGFDLVMESATKYLNGHSDVIAGCVAGRQEHIDKVLFTLEHLGGAIDPHAAFLLQRGIKTLALRVAQQNTNALALATRMEKHPAVATSAFRDSKGGAGGGQLGGYGGVFSFELAGGLPAATAFVRAVRLATFAPSLGGVETLVVLPATSSHAGQSAEQRAALGIADGLIRVAVGVEDTQDLIDDFVQAVDVAGAAGSNGTATTANGKA